ncbi:MAG: hypothetical protein CBB67_005945 [Alteromonadaceae bacterium TMED7]|uniref:hypothetical protein n=1 Tax=Alteromonas sp. TaxID=232 RepID=UPI000B6E1FE5|nr:hypothetical protein [Alteromonas sp.]MAI37816.1 hypothetical protein [Alteromonas sp.]RPH20505.1 MAG: hypothetical protein CBB67_005945 [Alteromonadaceae bacterium TMED7]|tara:strand:- start:4015 stop:4218 length:204 start_codon:yes stop_codon:yes gene_type:complete
MSAFTTDKYDRDPNSNALLSNDLAALQQYKQKKRQSKKLDEVCDDINSLKEDLALIKDAIQVILKNR